MNQIKFFLDFDGTITTEDVVDRVLDRFADSSWKDVEKDWHEGRIGSRECLARQIALVRATPEDFAKLLSEVHVDPYFVSFMKTAKSLAVPVTILSDGFDKIIYEILNRCLSGSPELLSGLPVYCNKLEWDGPRLKAVFPYGICPHGCANCKEALIRGIAWPAGQVVFVGDGWSDRFAAQTAYLTFAKEELLKFCEENNINHKRYTGFNDVEQWLIHNAVYRPEPANRTM
jgi:2,3-diketo-5-methylthio-1-phosphopentane phosphatase